MLKSLDPVKVAQELIAQASVTTEPNTGVTDAMRGLLQDVGFDVRQLAYTDLYGTPKIALEAKRQPAAATEQKGIGYFCHNDVVSVDGWNCSHGGPFDGIIADGKLWGRGACDMKGSAAAAIAAVSSLDTSNQTGPIYFFVTGDEECGMLGADILVNQSKYYAEMVESQSVGIIGEPTELQLVNMHKGGCHVDITSIGVAAHSSTVEGKNANWQMIPFLTFVQELAERCETDVTLQNSAFTPSTLSLNVVIENHPHFANITVGSSICRIFFRPMPDTPWENILSEIKEVGARMELDVKPLRPLLPLHTPESRPFVQESLELLGQENPLAVCYATDGCCFQQLKDLIVLGPGSIEQAHRPDEWITLEQLHLGTDVFARLLQRYAYRAA